MIRQEAILQSPLRILDRAIRGGLGKGRLGVILAPPGTGKSACLAQLGLDALLRGRAVLHVAVGQPVEHVSARHDALFDELAERVGLADRGGVREAIAHRRLIWSSSEGAFATRGLDEALDAFRTHLGREPGTILVEGLRLAEPAADATLAAVKASAARAGAELWMGVRCGGGGLAALPAGGAALVDVALVLEDRGPHASVTLAKADGRQPAAELALVIEGGSLRARAEDAAANEREIHADDCTLLASGSGGAEEEFGACAERWGVAEVNFTFAGRGGGGRTRGLVELSEDELRVGEVSAAYVKAHLHRALPESPELRRVLQIIWHQVITAGEVFAVGALLPDKTVHGGTGWAVELARHWGKPVHLFDQERDGWFRWDGQDWIAAPAPLVTRARFAGAGTRSPSDAGRAAIRGLFERSFGAAGA